MGPTHFFFSILLFTIVKSVHTITKATLKYDGNVSDSFMMKSGLKTRLRTCSYSFRDYLFYADKARFFSMYYRS